MNDAILKKDLEWITQRTPLPEGESIANVLARLDEVARDPNLPERLAHYLSKRSYLKALEWLDDPDLPHRL